MSVSDYTELLYWLRNDSCTDGSDCEHCPDSTRCYLFIMNKAADAIEEMNRRETPMKITEIHVDEYYCPACGAENNCDQGYVQDAYCPVCGQCLLSQPPENEET